mgnify:CR=1 FL=1
MNRIGNNRTSYQKSFYKKREESQIDISKFLNEKQVNSCIECIRVDKHNGNYGVAIVNKLTWKVRWILGIEKRIVNLQETERAVIVATYNKKIIVYCLKTLTLVFQTVLDVEFIQGLDFSRHATMAVCGYRDKEVRLFDFQFEIVNFDSCVAATMKGIHSDFRTNCRL